MISKLSYLLVRPLRHHQPIPGGEHEAVDAVHLDRSERAAPPTLAAIAVRVGHVAVTTTDQGAGAGWMYIGGGAAMEGRGASEGNDMGECAFSTRVRCHHSVSFRCAAVRVQWWAGVRG